MTAKPNSNQAQALIDAWDIVNRYRWQFIVPAFLICAAILTVSFMLPRKYKAVAMFERRVDMVMEEIVDRGASNTYEGPRATLVSEIAGEPAIDEMLEAQRDTLNAIARQEGIHLSTSDLRRSLLRGVLVQRDIHSKQLDRVRITYIGTNPAISRFAVNALVSNYIDRTRLELDRRLSDSEQFFQAEVDRARSQIEKLENGKLTFEIKHADLMPDTPNNIQTVMIDSQHHQTEVREKLDNAKAQAAAMTKRLADTARTIPELITTRNPEVARLDKQISELMSQHNEYVAVFKMTDKHPDLIDLRTQILDLKRKLAATPQEVVSEKRVRENPKYAELELLVAQANATVESLERQSNSIDTRITQLSASSVQLYPVRAQYNKIEREVEQAMRQLSFWEGNLNRVRMSSTAENGNRGIQLNFIKPCRQVTRPVSPDLKQLLLAAIALSIGAGTLSVILAHRTNESFSSGEDLSAALNVPLAGQVSAIESRSQKRTQRLRRFVLYPLNLAVMAFVLCTMTGLLYLNLERPDQYQKLMDNPAHWLTQLPYGEPDQQPASAVALMQERR